MDFQRREHVTTMQAIGGDTDKLNCTAPQMAASLSPEHAALRADIEIITSNLLDRFATTMCTVISELFAKNNTNFQNATNSLAKQIATLGTRVALISSHHLLQECTLLSEQRTELLKSTTGDIQTLNIITTPTNVQPIRRFLRATGLDQSTQLCFVKNDDSPINDADNTSSDSPEPYFGVFEP